MKEDNVGSFVKQYFRSDINISEMSYVRNIMHVLTTKILALF